MHVKKNNKINSIKLKNKIVAAYMRVNRKPTKSNSAQLKNEIVAAYMRVNRKPTNSAQHN